MEKKITGKFGRTMGWLLSLILIAALACIFVGFYPRMTLEGRLVYGEYIQNIGPEEATFSYRVLWNAVSAMGVDYVIFVLAGMTVVLFLGLLLPAIRPLGLKEGWKAHIPLEVLLFGIVCITGVVVEILPEFVMKCQMDMDYPGTVFYWLGIMERIVAEGRLVYVLRGVNGLIWFGVFFATYLCIINLRQLFSKGIVCYVRENTLVGRVCCWIFKRIRKAVLFCSEFDFNNKGTRKFILAVILNFIVIMLLCCIWYLGIFLAIPYSLLLLWLLQKKWNKIRTEYVTLLHTTEEMAKGVTDVEYVGTSDVFHELQTALSGVQEGFHTAVQEEIKSQRMKTELITNVSHDLKTPLTAIITYVDLLKNESLTEEERQGYIEVLERKSFRIKSLIEELIEISKAASGNIQLDKVNLDLGLLIQEVQMELEEEIMNSGIVFKMNLPEEKAMVCLDAQKTSRIFENLTVNILKHGLTGSRAYISLEQRAEEVQVVYKNISHAEINYNATEIMERFTRGDESRNTEGSGLGLAIVKSFTEAQGGTVQVELDGDLFKVTVSFPMVRTVECVTPEVSMKTEVITE